MAQFEIWLVFIVIFFKHKPRPLSVKLLILASYPNKGFPVFKTVFISSRKFNLILGRYKYLPFYKKT